MFVLTRSCRAKRVSFCKHSIVATKSLSKPNKVTVSESSVCKWLPAYLWFFISFQKYLIRLIVNTSIEIFYCVLNRMFLKTMIVIASYVNNVMSCILILVFPFSYHRFMTNCEIILNLCIVFLSFNFNVYTTSKSLIFVCICVFVYQILSITALRNHLWKCVTLFIWY